MHCGESKWDRTWIIGHRRFIRFVAEHLVDSVADLDEDQYLEQEVNGRDIAGEIDSESIEQLVGRGVVSDHKRQRQTAAKHHEFDHEKRVMECHGAGSDQQNVEQFEYEQHEGDLIVVRMQRVKSHKIRSNCMPQD